MFEGVHHVGHLVDDIDETTAFLTDVLDGTVTETATVDGKVDVAFVELPGQTVELISRRERGTYLDDLLDAHLEVSTTHTAFVVSDIAAAASMLETAGYPMFDPEPVEGLGPYVRAFVSPAAVPTPPIELVELGDE